MELAQLPLIPPVLTKHLLCTSAQGRYTDEHDTSLNFRLFLLRGPHCHEMPLRPMRVWRRDRALRSGKKGRAKMALSKGQGAGQCQGGPSLLGKGSAVGTTVQRTGARCSWELGLKRLARSRRQRLRIPGPGSGNHYLPSPCRAGELAGPACPSPTLPQPGPLGEPCGPSERSWVGQEAWQC